MARWKLNAPHYLNVEHNKWEYIEVDRKTGRPRRTQFDVPMQLDPADPTCWTEYTLDQRGQREDGVIIVTHKRDDNFPNDIVFFGDPTPEMAPIDEEAKAISKSLEAKWKRPAESEPGSYQAGMIKDLQESFQKVIDSQTKQPDLTEVLAAITGIMKQNQELLSALVAAQTGKSQAPAAQRRV